MKKTCLLVRAEQISKKFLLVQRKLQKKFIKVNNDKNLINKTFCLDLKATSSIRLGEVEVIQAGFEDSSFQVLFPTWARKPFQV